MQRWLLLAAILAGCGNVQSPATDGPPPRDLLTGTLRNGCVVALHMDEESWTGAPGEVKDDCGNDNPGTVNGQGTTTVAGGVSGRAGSFSGAACIDIPDATTLHGTTGLTLSAWILPTRLNNGDNANGVISKRNGRGDQPEYSLSVWQANNVYVDLDGEDTEFHSLAVITERTWQQLTMVYDGTRLQDQRARIYVNGSLDTTGSELSSPLTAYTSPLHIGCMPAPTATPPDLQHFFGEIDEVVIWNRALSDAEITQWYMNTKP
ncbi:MAG TPA: LamG domain-containing protein [Kofleriaceae bacterium]|nr:LamG domain-containing protein [Kofleriaceae bacterium]